MLTTTAFLIALVGQSPTPITQMSAGIATVGSRPDTDAPGGYGTSVNAPRANGTEFASAKGLSLVLRREGQNLTVYVVNASGREIAFRAQDSSLPIWLEAAPGKAAYRYITFLHQPTCGNSMHRVFLPTGQHWSLSKGPFAPGPLRATVRAKLHLGMDQNATAIYSNAIEMPLPRTIFDLPDVGYPAEFKQGYMTYKFGGS